ncbi:VCBS domain-containing protein [Aeromonas hydrophila]|uniref:VCBS domain-containing protein n=1 Tax=Aeromonas hydrophila TaxID=644 RepID=UPI0018B090E9
MGQYGEFTLAKDGQWTFTANSAFNELNVGRQGERALRGHQHRRHQVERDRDHHRQQ